MPVSRQYASPRRKRLLVVEDDPAQQLSIEALLGHDDIDVAAASTGAEALAVIKKQSTVWCFNPGCRTWDRFRVARSTRQAAVAGNELPVVVFTVQATRHLE